MNRSLVKFQSLSQSILHFATILILRIEWAKDRHPTYTGDRESFFFLCLFSIYSMRTKNTSICSRFIGLCSRYTLFACDLIIIYSVWFDSILFNYKFIFFFFLVCAQRKIMQTSDAIAFCYYMMHNCTNLAWKFCLHNFIARLNRCEIAVFVVIIVFDQLTIIRFVFFFSIFNRNDSWFVSHFRLYKCYWALFGKRIPLKCTFKNKKCDLFKYKYSMERAWLSTDSWFQAALLKINSNICNLSQPFVECIS